jgi:predicted transcriptional regulator
MATKKKRATPFNIQDAFAQHVHANNQAHAWAEKCLQHRATGEAAKAKSAEAKATSWLRKVLAFEARVAIGKPQGGRPAE